VAAAVAALAVALVLSPWVLRREPPPDPVELLVNSSVAEHRRILLELQSAPREVADATAAFAAVRALTDIQLAPVFAGDDKLRLLAAAPTLLADRKAAAATLGHRSGATATYFAVPGKDLGMPAAGRVQIEQYRPHMRRVETFHVIYWKQADLAYLMVTDLDEAHTRQLFLKMRKAL
jgi:hypothetical protein